jgi:hypothetical protein
MFPDGRGSSLRVGMYNAAKRISDRQLLFHGETGRSVSTYPGLVRCTVDVERRGFSPLLTETEFSTKLTDIVGLQVPNVPNTYSSTYIGCSYPVWRTYAWDFIRGLPVPDWWWHNHSNAGLLKIQKGEDFSVILEDGMELPVDDKTMIEFLVPWRGDARTYLGAIKLQAVHTYFLTSVSQVRKTCLYFGGSPGYGIAQMVSSFSIVIVDPRDVDSRLNGSVKHVRKLIDRESFSKMIGMYDPGEICVMSDIRSGTDPDDILSDALLQDFMIDECVRLGIPIMYKLQLLFPSSNVRRNTQILVQPKIGPFSNEVRGIIDGESKVDYSLYDYDQLSQLVRHKQLEIMSKSHWEDYYYLHGSNVIFTDDFRKYLDDSMFHVFPFSFTNVRNRESRVPNHAMITYVSREATGYKTVSADTSSGKYEDFTMSNLSFRSTFTMAQLSAEYGGCARLQPDGFVVGCSEFVTYEQWVTLGSTRDLRHWARSLRDIFLTRDYYLRSFRVDPLVLSDSFKHLERHNPKVVSGPRLTEFNYTVRVKNRRVEVAVAGHAINVMTACLFGTTCIYQYVHEVEGNLKVVEKILPYPKFVREKRSGRLLWHNAIDFVMAVFAFRRIIAVFIPTHLDRAIMISDILLSAVDRFVQEYPWFLYTTGGSFRARLRDQ